MNIKSVVAVLVSSLAFSTVAQADPFGGQIGPLVTSIRGNSVDTRTVNLRSYEVTRFEVVGDGSTDLDCYVIIGGLVYSDDDATDHCIIDVPVTIGGSVIFKVVNQGYYTNAYVWQAY